MPSCWCTGNRSCVSSISALPGGHHQHPVDDYYYWILAFARMTARRYYWILSGACTEMLSSSARMTTPASQQGTSDQVSTPSCWCTGNRSCVSSISALPGGHHPHPVDLSINAVMLVHRKPLLRFQYFRPPWRSPPASSRRLLLLDSGVRQNDSPAILLDSFWSLH